MDQVSTVMGADEPSRHLVAAGHHVGHACINVVGGQPPSPAFAEGLLIFLADFSEVVKNCRGLDGLNETRKRVSGVHEHRFGSFARSTPDVLDVLRIGLLSLWIIARSRMGERPLSHVVTGKQASSTGLTRSTSSFGRASGNGK